MMTLAPDEIVLQAERLPELERVQLIRRLIASLEPSLRQVLFDAFLAALGAISAPESVSAPGPGRFPVFSVHPDDPPITDEMVKKLLSDEGLPAGH
jgi:hypothetical protein